MQDRMLIDIATLPTYRKKFVVVIILSIHVCGLYIRRK